MKSLFLKVKPSTVFLLMKDSEQTWYPSKLARASNSSYVHTVNFLSELTRLGVAVREKKGKRNVYKLTEKGAILATALDDFVKKCVSLETEAKHQAASALPEAPIAIDNPQKNSEKSEKAKEHEQKGKP